MEGRYEVVGLNNRTELKEKGSMQLTRYLFMTIMKECVCQGNILKRQNHFFHLIGNKMNGNNIQ